MTPPLQGPDVGYAISQLERLDQCISKEFSLVNDRMTWLVVSQSFLMAAFVASVVGYDSAPSLQAILRLFLLVVPFFGILVALLVFVAIRAASSATDKLKLQRERLEKTLPAHLQIEPVGAMTREHDRGNWPPAVIPHLVWVVWAILLGVAIYSVVKQ